MIATEMEGVPTGGIFNCLKSRGVTPEQAPASWFLASETITSRSAYGAAFLSASWYFGWPIFG